MIINTVPKEKLKGIPLNTIATSNFFGGKPFGSVRWWTDSGCCHYEFSVHREDEVRFTAATHSSSAKYRDTHNKMYEFMLDDELSPWRDLFQHIQVSPIRNRDDIIGVAISDFEDVNRYAVHHFLKAFRAVYEGHQLVLLPKYGDKVNSDDYWKLYLLDHYVVPQSEKRGMVSFGGEHMAWKTNLCESILKKEMLCDFKEYPYKTSANFMNGCLTSLAWLNGKMSLGYPTMTALRGVLRRSEQMGYFTGPLTHTKNSTGRFFEIDDAFEKMDNIISHLTVKPKEIDPFDDDYGYDDDDYDYEEGYDDY